jgi:deazaflavin-dependent oxidoreductase (nitroreductase family)
MAREPTGDGAVGRGCACRWQAGSVSEVEAPSAALSARRAPGGWERFLTRLEHLFDTRSERLSIWLVRKTRGAAAWRLYHRRVLVLTTRGRRTGRVRTVVVQWFPDGDDFIVVAANSGMPSPPGWYFNLMATHRAAVEVGGKKLEITAQELSAEEAASFWPRVLEAAPDYARYRSRTHRRIALVRLSPIRGGNRADTEATLGSEPARGTTSLNPVEVVHVGARRVGLSVAAGLVATSAYAGAFGLATGLDPYMRPLRDRLPFKSPALGAAALSAVVAIPYTELARRAWKGDPRTDALSAAAGVTLIGWVIVERVVLRVPSFVETLYGLIGAAFVVAGRRALAA